MTITNCPKCGSMNITTAGVCANCGWSQFNKSMVSTGVLLDDYKRLLLENRNLKERVAELEAMVEQLIWVGNDLLIDNANPVTVVLFNGLVAKAKEKERER
jgi:predicted nucleic-acid-binding Zn-ribbon protein